ncbi:MAG: glycosyltransferase family 2 protein [Anaerolineales bacterium]|nr:glycosyltransferase family 2 protein [Anaerolineales bacterium]
MAVKIISVVVNWNLKEDTLECLHSLLEAGAQAESIILVDNHSTDGSIAAVETEFAGKIQTVQSGKNLGYAGGANLGIAHALEAGADWVFLLNNDTVVSEVIFDEFQQDIAEHDEYSLFAPTIFYYDHRETIWFYGVNRVADTLITIPIIQDREAPDDLPDVQEIDFVSGCALLINRDFFDRVGMFNPELFMYGEELDLLQRGHLAGFRFAVSRDARMWHKVSRSAAKDQPKMRYYQIRNQNRFYRVYSSGLVKGVMFVFSLFKIGLTTVSDVFHGHFDLLNPLLAGWYDGWFNTRRSM